MSKVFWERGGNPVKGLRAVLSRSRPTSEWPQIKYYKNYVVAGSKSQAVRMRRKDRDGRTLFSRSWALARAWDERTRRTG
jgi:hypothetical protein